MRVEIGQENPEARSGAELGSLLAGASNVFGDDGASSYHVAAHRHDSDILCWLPKRAARASTRKHLGTQ